MKRRRNSPSFTPPLTRTTALSRQPCERIDAIVAMVVALCAETSTCWPRPSFSTTLSFEVERDAALIAGVRPPEQAAFRIGRVTRERPDSACGGAARRLDRHHVGTEVGEDLAAKQPAFVAEIEHPVPRQHT